MIISFKEFLDNLILESLHPELNIIATSRLKSGSKQGLLSKKIKELNERGEKTGIEGNMPKGSSRAYLQHSEPHEIILDGKSAKIKTGTKIAIKSGLDRHHNSSHYNGLSLGELQNQTEGGKDHYTQHYRILKHDPKRTGHYKTNEEEGIFPPLIDHDEENHTWTHVGHVRDIKEKEFQTLTKTPSHPEGIKHFEFVKTLVRHHDMNEGKHREYHKDIEKKLDIIEKHPLVQKFINYHDNSYEPPHDYLNIKNLGVFEHPNGTKHIVARDHGFSNTVRSAYADARETEHMKKKQNQIFRQ